MSSRYANGAESELASAGATLSEYLKRAGVGTLVALIQKTQSNQRELWRRGEGVEPSGVKNPRKIKDNCRCRR